MKKNKITDSLRQQMKNEYFEAIKKLRIAEINFENANPDFIDLANAELTAAQTRVDTIRKIFLLT